MHEAEVYEKLPDAVVLCGLCPHNCRLAIGKSGICRVRKNIDGTLVSRNYGKLTAIHSDPIEKKPLYHFFPGRNILSIGSFGCNLTCTFCQNCDISQSGPDDFPDLHEYSPEHIVNIASSDPDNLGLAFTYNEPGIFYEFMLDSARLTRKKGLMNVIVTNGYINREPLEQLLKVSDAFNVDLKAFSKDFFQKYTHSTLQPVLDTLLQIRCSGSHLEITNLVIPDLNDDAVTFRKMVEWIASNLGKETILHLSRYFPRYKLSIESTALASLIKLADIAREYLSFVYIGNASALDQQDTFCPNCKILLIQRINYSVEIIGLNAEGQCLNCGHETAIRMVNPI